MYGGVRELCRAEVLSRKYGKHSGGRHLAIYVDFRGIQDATFLSLKSICGLLPRKFSKKDRGKKTEPHNAGESSLASYLTVRALSLPTQ